MLQIAPEIKAKIKELNTDGLKRKDIQAKIFDLFQRVVSASSLSYILNPKKKGPKKASSTGRKTGRRKGTADSTGETPEAILKEIHEKIDELQAAYVERLKQIRGDLIVAVAKLRKQ